MIDITKHLEFFNPIEIEDAVHIIGVGAIGSTIVENLARLGFTDIHLYDFDDVCPHNIANQVYFSDQIGKSKLDAITETCVRINPDIEIIHHKEGWKPHTRLNGYVFLAVDNIEIRKAIVTENKFNTSIKAMFDFRMGLADAQHYAVKWGDIDAIDRFYETMNFSHEEAKEATPVSACGTTLSVVTTVRTIVALGISNFINLIKNDDLQNMIIINAFTFMVDNIKFKLGV